MLLKNESASLKLDFVSYEFPEAGIGTDEYDRNWLLLRCTWVNEEGYTRKDSNTCLLAQELAARGICVRAGLHCAPLAHESAGTLQTGTVRISLSAFNTEQQMQQTAQAVREILGEGH